jgi:hypothetical protein
VQRPQRRLRRRSVQHRHRRARRRSSRSCRRQPRPTRRHHRIQRLRSRPRHHRPWCMRRPRRRMRRRLPRSWRRCRLLPRSWRRHHSLLRSWRRRRHRPAQSRLRLSRHPPRLLPGRRRRPRPRWFSRSPRGARRARAWPSSTASRFASEINRRSSAARAEPQVQPALRHERVRPAGAAVTLTSRCQQGQTGPSCVAADRSRAWSWDGAAGGSEHQQRSR